MLSFKGLQLLELARGTRRQLHASRPTPEHAVAYLLAPARQHERVNVEGIGDGLHLDTSMWLSFTAVTLNSTL
jgi:hypothetical protein